MLFRNLVLDNKIAGKETAAYLDNTESSRLAEKPDNTQFTDWSVRKVGLKENWTLKWHMQFDTSGPWTMAGGVQPEDGPKWMRGFKDY